jgi:outer membrane protein
MKHTPITAALFACGVLACASASAQESPWFWRVGPAHLAFDSSATFTLGGGPAPAGTNAEAKDNTTLGLEIGYKITPEWTGRLLLGLPPTTTLTGSGGPVAGLDLAKVVYGPAALTATYGLGQWGSIRPYVGAGIAYNIIFKEKDRLLTDVKIKNSFGTVLQAGFDVPLDKDWSVGLDVRKIFLSAKATATAPDAFGRLPVTAKVKLDPLVFFVSVGKRF